MAIGNQGNRVLSQFEGLESRTMLAAQFPGAGDNSLAYDAKGNLHVAYYDSTEHDLKYVIQKAGASTFSNPLIIDHSSKDVGQQLSLAIDKNGNPGIAYRDSSKKDLKFARFDGKKWVVATVDSRNDTGTNPDLVFDGKNHALISYYRASAGDLQLAAQTNNNGWTFTTIANKNVGGQQSSIAIDPATGKPAVAFAGKDGKVRYVEQTGSTFKNPTVVDGLGAGNGTDISLTFDGSKKPAFSYFDASSGDIKLATKTGKNFTVTDIATVPAGQDPTPTLLVNPKTGKAQIVYYDSSSNGVFVAQDDGTGTIVTTQLKSGGGAGTTAVINPKTGDVAFTGNNDDGTFNLDSTKSLPATPTNVSATAVSLTQINVTWSDNSNNEASFIIDRSMDGGVNFVTLATVAANTTSYSDTTAVEATSYTYRVTASGSKGDKSIGVPLASVTTLPAAPTNVVGTALSTTSVKVTWSDNSGGETGFAVERSTDGSTFTSVGVTAANVLTLTDTGLTEATSYTYRVTAVNSAGSSAAATGTGTTVPSAPTNVSAVAISAAIIDVMWADNSRGESSYLIERSGDGGNTFATAGTASANTSSFQDTGLSEGKTYQYRVTALDSGGSSTAAVASGTTLPAAPTGVSGAAASTTAIDVTWTDHSTGETGFVIERSANGGDTWTNAGTTSANDTTFHDSGLTEGRTYQYRVRATNAGGSSAAVVGTGSTLPLAPTAVSTTSISASAIDVSWTDNSNGETSFTIERSSDGGAHYTLAGTSNPNVTTFHDTALNEGTTYTYRITTVSAGGSSSTALGIGTTRPAAPTGLAITGTTSGSVSLSWSDNSAAETGYDIARDDGDGFVTVGHVAAGHTTFTDSTAAEGSSYSYLVFANGSAGNSANSNTVVASTQPAAPTIVSATPTNATHVTVSWANHSFYETGFEVYRSTDGGDTFTLAGTPVANATTFNDIVVEGSNNIYKVRAVENTLFSTYSGTASTTTVPAAPGSVVGVSTSASHVNVAWSDNSNHETSYVIDRSDDGGDTYHNVGSTGANGVAFADTTVSAGATYTYRVKAVGNGGSSTYGFSSSVLVIPAAPVITATAVSTTRVNISFAAVTGAASYVVERSTDGFDQDIQQFSTGTNSYADMSAAESSVYQYRVRAINASGESVNSNVQTATTFLGAPTSLHATLVASHEIDIAWTDNSGAENAFNIERSVSGGQFMFLDSVNAGVTSYQDGSAQEGVAYSYRVYATNDVEDSDFSNLLPETTPLIAPDGLSAVAASLTTVNVSWNDNSGAETGYEIYRSTNGAQAVSIHTTAAGVSTYPDTVTEGSTYVYTVRAINAIENSAFTAPFSVTILPAAPTGLSLGTVGSGSVQINWTDNSSHETGYRVERATGAGSFDTHFDLSAGTITYTDSTVSENTSYRYRVFAINGAGDSAPSSTVTTQTLAVAPTSLHATSITASNVHLQWNDNSSAESGYIVLRSDNGGGFVPFMTLPADTVSYDDGTVTGGTNYTYRVVATNATTGTSATNDLPVLTLPAAPSSANAVAVSDDTVAKVTWSSVTGATGYYIERSTDNVTFGQHFTVGNVLQYTDSSAVEGTLYYYRVSGINATGTGLPSTVTSVTTLPAAVSNLHTTTVAATQIDLAWTDNSSGETGYLVERSQDGGANFTPRFVTAANATSYSDTGLEGTAYVYRVKGVDITGTGLGVSVNVTTLPATPTGLAATPISATEIDLTWVDHSAHETSYVVQRSSDNGMTFPDTFTLAINAQSYHDTSVVGGQSYVYQIIAVGAGGNSAASNQQTVLTIPGAVTDLAATTVSDVAIDLTWSDVAGETGYTINRSTDGGAHWALAGNPAMDDTLFHDTGLTEGLTYTYQIIATNGTGSSDDSNHPAATTLPGAVTGVTPTVVSATRVNLTWTQHSAHETGFEVSRIAAGDSDYTVLNTVGVNVTSYSDLAASGGTSYTYRVRAVQGLAFSAQTLSSAVLTYPAAPQNVAADTLTTTSVHLTWDAVTGADSYIVERSDDAGNSFNVMPVGTPSTNAQSDNGLTEGTLYVYRVTAVNATGNSVASSLLTIVTKPAVPTGFGATAISANEIDLAWTDNSANNTSYRLERSTDGGDTWPTTVSLGANVHTYHDTTVLGGTTYTYRVVAVVTAAGITEESASTTDTKTTVPDSVGTVNVTFFAANEVDISWTNVHGETGYHITRSDDGGMTFGNLPDAAVDATSYQDMTAVENTTYIYEVTAFNGAGTAVAVDSNSVTTVPIAPTGLSATATSATHVDLAWTDNSSRETGYDIFRSDDGGGHFTMIHHSAANAHSYTDTGANEGVNEQYFVVADGDSGGSDPSNTASALTPLIAPTGLTAATVSDSTIHLAWTDNSGAETGYEIQRKTGAGSFATIFTTAANVHVYNDATAAEDTTYTYQVIATEATVEDSAASNSDTAETLLTPPTNSHVSAKTDVTVDISWTDNSSVETAYRIERSDDNGMSFMEVHTVGANVTTYQDTGLTEGTHYIYQIRASHAGNFSAYDSTVSATTLPATPTGINVTAFSTTEIDIAWTDNSTTESGYVVERSSDGGMTFPDTFSLGADAHSYADMSVTEASDYEYRVHAVGAGGDSAESSATSLISTKPLAPSGASATVLSATSVDVTWTDHSAGESGFQIERSENGGGYHQIGTTAANVTTFHDTNAPEATIVTYQIRAQRNGSESAYSAASTGVTTLPAAPTVLGVTAPTNTRVVLTWTDNSNGETGYKIERSTDGGDHFLALNTIAANSITYSDNTATEGMTYVYRVYAYDVTGPSDFSNTATASTAPNSPTGMAGSAISPSRIDISWTDHSSHEMGFHIERSTNGGVNFTVLTDVAADVTTYSDTSVTEGLNYQYRVRAFGTTGLNSGYTTSVSVTTPLIAPTTLAATGFSATRVDLTWVDNSSVETAYKIERGTDGVTFGTVFTTSANATSYSDTTAHEGTLYYYRVKATKGAINSGYTNIFSLTTIPAAPTAMTATVASDTQVNLTWSDNSTGESNFTIERSDNGGSFTFLTTPAANATSFNDTSLVEGNSYTYRIKANDAGGSSAFSTSAQVTTNPAAPTVLTASSPSSDVVLLSWHDNSAHETGYTIERSTDNFMTSTTFTAVANATSYTDGTVAEATLYQYRVRANLNAASSANSNTFSVTTVPASPDTLAAVPFSTTRIDLTWHDNSSGEVSYRVERSDDNGASFHEIVSLAANTTSYHDTGVTEGLEYQYRIRAADAGGFSGYSETVDATTYPAAPTNLVATAISDTEVDLTFTDNSVGEQGFVIERADNGGMWHTIDTIGPDSQSYVDLTVTAGNTYDYRIHAFNSTGSSADSNTGTATTPV